MDIDRDTPELDVPAGHTLSDTPVEMAPLNPNAVADALEKKIQQQRLQQQEQAKAKGFVAFDEDHEKRQDFRRMIDPGILPTTPNAS